MNTLTFPLDPMELRPLLHAKLDSISGEELAAVHRLLVEFERHRLFQQMADEAEEDRCAGRVAVDFVQQAIREHRARHPYRS